ncbi:MAG: molybdenum cofactor guanylyltransferase [Clostridia bacterium]
MKQDQEAVCGVILAGGQSRRMGRRKELLTWNEGTMIEHLVESITSLAIPCLVVTNEPDLLPDTVCHHPDVQVNPDEVQPCGPLGGIITAFRKRREGKLLLLSCDLPFVDREELERFFTYQSSIKQWDAILAQSDGKIHPLFGFYHRRTQPAWEHAYEQSQYRLMDTINKLAVHFLPAGLLGTWATFNANTPDEYTAALAEWRRRHGQ